jgi:hypothetical protein
MMFHSTAAPPRRGREPTLLAHLDRLILDLAIAMGAEERQYPVLISREALQKAEYPSPTRTRDASTFLS